nr:EOG090X0CBY [Scapholeberis mucronata]
MDTKFQRSYVLTSLLFKISNWMRSTRSYPVVTAPTPGEHPNFVMGIMAASIVQNVLSRAAEDEAEKLKSIQVDKVVELEYDLGNLLAYDINDLDINSLKTEKESYLTNLTRDNLQLLINQLFQIPTTKVDNEVVIKLPSPSTRLPRAKPAPKAKELSKWEKYAKEKGITLRKKSKATWDEDLKNWVPRFGYKKNLAEREKNWVVEVPGNVHDSVDPIALKKTKKQEAIAKNELQRLRNISARMKKSKTNVSSRCSTTWNKWSTRVKGNSASQSASRITILKELLVGFVWKMFPVTTRDSPKTYANKQKEIIFLSLGKRAGRNVRGNAFVHPVKTSTRQGCLYGKPTYYKYRNYCLKRKTVFKTYMASLAVILSRSFLPHGDHSSENHGTPG